MNLIFMGSSNFAVASLSALLDSEHKILLTVAQPDKPAGRGFNMQPCPVSRFAKEKDLLLETPHSLKSNSEFLRKVSDLKPDAIIVVAYGKLLPKELLKLPKFGCINVHASLLPKYRGAAPINWAVINGETMTGVTTMFLNEKMDEGDILLQCSTEIQDSDTSETLYEHLAAMGAELLVRTLEQVEAGELKGLPQNHTEATYAPILNKEDGLIDWNMSARDIYNRVRGLLPWPKAYTFINGKQLTIFDSALIDDKTSATPGTVTNVERGITVATGNGLSVLLDVQLEGKKRMPAVDFVRGSSLKAGDKF